MEKQETFDIVNENDEVIGTATREECHNNPNIIHRVVHFTLFDKENSSVLFTKRSLKKKFDAGKSVFLGEHVLTGETYEDAVIRGVKEELGIDLKEVKYFCTTSFEQPDQTEIAKFYLVYWDHRKMKFDFDEVEDIWWVKAKNLRNYNDNVGYMTRYWIENIDWNKVL